MAVVAVSFDFKNRNSIFNTCGVWYIELILRVEYRQLTTMTCLKTVVHILLIYSLSLLILCYAKFFLEKYSRYAIKENEHEQYWIWAKWFLLIDVSSKIIVSIIVNVRVVVEVESLFPIHIVCIAFKYVMYTCTVTRSPIKALTVQLYGWKWSYTLLLLLAVSSQHLLHLLG